MQIPISCLRCRCDRVLSVLIARYESAAAGHEKSILCQQPSEDRCGAIEGLRPNTRRTAGGRHALIA